jgi:hypothetical protein
VNIKVNNAAERAFVEACYAHDLTWDYSDDPRMRRRGSKEKQLINRMAHELGDMRRVKELWDAVVDATMREDAREQFYWRMP